MFRLRGKSHLGAFGEFSRLNYERLGDWSFRSIPGSRDCVFSGRFDALPPHNTRITVRVYGHCTTTVAAYSSVSSKLQCFYFLFFQVSRETEPYIKSILRSALWKYKTRILSIARVVSLLNSVRNSGTRFQTVPRVFSH